MAGFLHHRLTCWQRDPCELAAGFRDSVGLYRYALHHRAQHAFAGSCCGGRCGECGAVCLAPQARDDRRLLARSAGRLDRGAIDARRARGEKRMSTLQSWGVVLALGLGTFLIRYSFIGLFANRDMPAWLSHGLKLVVPAIFAAIVASGVGISAGQFGGWALWPKYGAAAMALAVALRCKGNILMTVITGMAALHALLALQRWLA
ncbi:MAG: AzlD domain-containing protein [Burkholderiales bacterium]|nr:MAG: AzlD domain-containing protein [Burkholderiales bacterium]